MQFSRPSVSTSLLFLRYCHPGNVGGGNVEGTSKARYLFHCWLEEPTQMSLCTLTIGACEDPVDLFWNNSPQKAEKVHLYSTKVPD